MDTFLYIFEYLLNMLIIVSSYFYIYSPVPYIVYNITWRTKRTRKKYHPPVSYYISRFRMIILEFVLLFNRSFTFRETSTFWALAADASHYESNPPKLAAYVRVPQTCFTMFSYCFWCAEVHAAHDIDPLDPTQVLVMWIKAWHTGRLVSAADDSDLSWSFQSFWYLSYVALA